MIYQMMLELYSNYQPSISLITLLFNHYCSIHEFKLNNGNLPIFRCVIHVYRYTIISVSETRQAPSYGLENKHVTCIELY